MQDVDGIVVIRQGPLPGGASVVGEVVVVDVDVFSAVVLRCTLGGGMTSSRE